MSKMGYIAYLAENNMRDELIEEVGSTRMADGFIQASKQIEKNKENKAYKVLYSLQQEHVKEGEKENERRKSI
tara:strand:+ start:161 stop:379 length:219 start_codon:yes stop_codon:yes gene_type:complete